MIAVTHAHRAFFICLKNIHIIHPSALLPPQIAAAVECKISISILRPVLFFTPRITASLLVKLPECNMSLCNDFKP